MFYEGLYVAIKFLLFFLIVSSLDLFPFRGKLALLISPILDITLTSPTPYRLIVTLGLVEIASFTTIITFILIMLVVIVVFFTTTIYYTFIATTIFTI